VVVAGAGRLYSPLWWPLRVAAVVMTGLPPPDASCGVSLPMRPRSHWYSSGLISPRASRCR
jgi:hypothetical protein